VASRAASPNQPRETLGLPSLPSGEPPLSEPQQVGCHNRTGPGGRQHAKGRDAVRASGPCPRQRINEAFGRVTIQRLIDRKRAASSESDGISKRAVRLDGPSEDHAERMVRNCDPVSD
jgi:hypothetical protein